MRASVSCLFALALAFGAGCGREQTQNSTKDDLIGIRTASAAEATPQNEKTVDEKTKVDEPTAKKEETKTADEKADRLVKDADAKADKLMKDADAKCEQLKKTADAQGDKLKKDAQARADRMKAEPKAHAVKPTKAKQKHATKEAAKPSEEPVGQTTITKGEVQKPPRPPEERPSQALPPPPSAQPAGAEPYVNHSTVLGDGKSGMYTDGQGTYGGRATWGTGTPRR